jgi:hypothetical protein
MLNRLSTCVGCNHVYTAKNPRVFVCDFQCGGFPLNGKWAIPCRVSYHATCIKAKEPLRTRLVNDKGLICPAGIQMPHFICKLCQLREIMQRELKDDEPDTEALLMERIWLIDVLNWWQASTLKTYQPYLKFLSRFELRYGATILQATELTKLPHTPNIPLMWAQLLYSLRTHQGNMIKFNTVRMLQSAASLYYTMDLHAAYPGQVCRERKRDEVRNFVIPSEESQATFATKGMARRLGTQTKQSWALSHVHIMYMNTHFH